MQNSQNPRGPPAVETAAVPTFLKPWLEPVSHPQRGSSRWVERPEETTRQAGQGTSES